MASSSATLAGSTASDLFRSSASGFTGVPLRTLGRAGLVLKRRDLTVSVTAKVRKWKRREYPWTNADPNIKGGTLRLLSPFKPLKEKPKPVILEFEKPIRDLEKKINDVKKMANETGLDFTDQIGGLEAKYQQALRNLYTNLAPIQRLNIARHPHRPTTLDHIFNITEKFMELHGDREGYDDPSIVTGLGSIDGRTYMFIGHQKGRNTKEHIKRNFGMPTPHGYRKALRLMQYADHHGFPIVTLIDTPGAFADLKCEGQNQGEAIAQNLRSMFGFKVPIISIVIGEGGSGGALAIGCGNKLLMLQNAVFFVASPEACAAILWKSAKAAPKAARKLRITATELCRLQIADGIIPEPLGGAHVDPEWTSQQIKSAINKAMDELTKLSTEDLLKDRMLKFRKLGAAVDETPRYLKKKINMGKRKGMPVLIKRKGLPVPSNRKDIPVPPKGKDIPVPPKGKDIPVPSNRKDIPVPPKGKDIPVPPKRKDIPVLSKRKNIPVRPKISYSEIEVEITKLKKNILEGKDSSSAPSKLNLDKAIKKLEREVGHEFSEAVKALGLTERLSKLREETAKASSGNQPLNPLVKEEIEKFNASFNQGLSAAPNSSKLQKKRALLRELTNVKLLVDKNKEAATLKQELKKKFDDVMNNPRLKENYEALQSEIQRVGASSGSDLDDELKKKIIEFNKEVDLELANAVKSVGLELTNVKLLVDKNKEAATLKQELKKKFDDVMNNPRIKENYEALQSEIQRVGASSGSDLDDELKKKIIEFNKEVDLELANAVKSVGLEVEFVKPGGGVDKSSVPQIEELSKDVQKEIETVANSSTDIKRLMEQLKQEVAKSGGKPDSESKKIINDLTKQIKNSLAEAVDLSSLKEKYENLTRPAGDSLTDEELRQKVGANRSFS
ncbi:acetyl-coenzyme A carboxylase carboxyl transferase subunit alpha, chloroplastic-like [Vicia villosa]|uniref:acetyl-coenzyme A carboxylase carboxyl transferase subunit alpha, chloroplastic-like n=1 Tax=Vicia villosa TaxID=3911 RepID=UPI00273CC945|nr:acetyl-coenzyme A carboxylase carboxyl transferase subunit alpha, chloroplastic-like [Vicia villosa]